MGGVVVDDEDLRYILGLCENRLTEPEDLEVLDRLRQALPPADVRDMTPEDQLAGWLEQIREAERRGMCVRATRSGGCCTKPVGHDGPHWDEFDDIDDEDET